jgi:hypothetical protein
MTLDQSTFDIDFDRLPGGLGVIRLMVTDGFRTAIADSKTFQVPTKGVHLQILTPGEGDQFDITDTISFRGQAYDVDRRTGADVSLQWSSSRDGYLGSGPLVISRISEGTHEIALATPDGVNVQRASITIHIGHNT